jgi:hypothetical protein
VRREVKAKMDSSDGLVNGEVYWAHEIIAYGCSGGQKAGEQQEMVDMCIPRDTGRDVNARTMLVSKTVRANNVREN